LLPTTTRIAGLEVAFALVGCCARDVFAMPLFLLPRANADSSGDAKTQNAE
jgi:hypothetical protein